MKQALNDVRIEGYLNEVDLELKEDREGRSFIAGKVILKVPQAIGGKEDISEIPVNVFSYEVTKAGKESPAFKSAKSLLDHGVSLASVDGDETRADKFTCSGGSLAENQFMSKDEKKVSYNLIRGSFFNKVTKTFNPIASFETEIVIKGIEKEEKDDIATGRLILNGIVVQYNDNCDIVTFVVESPEAVNFISSSWQEGDTVKVTGRIRWTVEEKEIESTDEVGFGEPETRIVERQLKEFVITSGSKTPYPSETAYDPDEIVKALTAKREAFEAKAKEQSSADSGSSSGLRGF